MESIEIVFDHVEKQYVLGYVLVTCSYADKKKAYPVNFEFRLSTEEDKQQRKLEADRKKEGIDLRKKDSLIQLIEFQKEKGTVPAYVEVTGNNMEAKTLIVIDNQGISWIGLPNKKTKLLNNENKPFDFNELQRITQNKKPIVLHIQGWFLYVKKVVLVNYGTLDFIIVTDTQGQKLGMFLTKSMSTKEKVKLIDEFFARQQPADNNKLNIALRLIKRAKKAGIKAENIVFDSWFWVSWFVLEALEIDNIKRAVSRLKENCELIYKEQNLKAGELFTQVQFHHVTYQGRSIKVAKIIVRLNNFPHPVTLVLIQELDKSRRVKAQYILVCTDTNYSWKKVIDAYKLRWTIEVFFRTAKQRFALSNFHTLSFNKIHSHVTSCFLAYLLCAQLKICNPKLADLTLGQIIDSFLNSPIILEKKSSSLVVYLDPAFVQLFGMPFDSS